MRRSCVVTLLTDFGNQDAYVGIMKGVIAGINPRANTIDICHSIPPQDIFSGAYLLYTSYKYFPKGTIHVAVVDPGVGGQRAIVCVETRNYIFLSPDNGLLSFIIQEERPKSIIRVTNNRYFLPSPSSTFHGRDVFAPVAAHLSLGIKPQKLGIVIDQMERLEIPKPTYKKPGQLEGQIVFVDRFGNLITNITREHIAQCNHKQFPLLILPFCKGRGVKKSSAFSSLQGRGKVDRQHAMETVIGRKKIVGLSKTYTDVKSGEPLVLLGSAGFLEVSINQGNARKYFNVDRGSNIVIKSVSR